MGFSFFVLSFFDVDGVDVVVDVWTLNVNGY